MFYKVSSMNESGFISGIKMYAYADKHILARKMILLMCFQMLQAVVIENAIIYLLIGGAFTVNVSMLWGVSRYTWLKAQVVLLLYVDGVVITDWGRFSGRCAFLNTSAFERRLSENMR